MKVSRTRLLRIDMGNWEKFEFGATYSVDHVDLGYSEDQVAEMAALDNDGTDTHTLFDELLAEVERGLNALLRADVLDAANLTDEKKSFILAAHHLEDTTTTRRPRKSRR